MIEVEERFLVTGRREAVWAVYSDHVGWSTWTGLGRVTLARAGQLELDGVGAIRAIDNFGLVVREEITGFAPPERLTYRLLPGPVPMHDHAGEVLFEDRGEATSVVWRCHFEARLGLWTAMQATAAGTFRHVLWRLDQRMRSLR